MSLHKPLVIASGQVEQIQEGDTLLALLTPPAGTIAAGTAPLKLLSGVSLTAPEAGAIEFTTDNLYFTITTGIARKNVTLDEGLTTGRVPYATTNGRLTDAAALAFDGTTLSATQFSGGGASVTGVVHNSGEVDHGGVGGLGDDDHSQYHTDGRAATWLAANHETTYNHANYDTAYDWGDHASAGYLTSESDTLDSVVGRGSSTASGVTVGNLTDSALTSGRVVIAGASGLLGDSASLTWNGSILYVSGYSVQKLIASNIALYIATTGDDSTGDGSAGAPWLTIGRALTFLEDKIVASTATVDIVVDYGHYYNVNLIWKHPNSASITLQALTTLSKTLTSIQSSSGSSGAYDFILNLNTITDITVGDYIKVPYSVTGGTNPTYLQGCWEITNVDVVNTRITISSSLVGATLPSGAVAGTVYILRAILHGGTGSMFDVLSGACLNLANVALVGPAPGTTWNVGLTLRGGASLNTKLNIGFSNHWAGIYCYAGSSGYLRGLPISKCTYGIITSGSNVDLQQSVIVGNTVGLSSSCALFYYNQGVIIGNTTNISRSYQQGIENLTAGRIPYAQSSNVLTDSSNLTYDGSYLKSNGYKSSDGSAGTAGSFTTVDGKTVTVKSGLITSIV
jgi:hypothetical protein